jgi:membrane complex biogenesis BtpA family protein
MNAIESPVLFDRIFHTRKPLIGMIHLSPLPGSPRYNGDGISGAVDAALRDAKALQKGGIDGLPIGVNVLRNGAIAALAIANVIRARFIRVNVFAESLLTDQGIIDACAHDLIRFRKQLGALDVAVFADVRSKHAAPLSSRPVEESARDAAYRGMADALIVTGPRTGAEPDKDQLHRIRVSVPDKRILIGSGLTKQNAVRLLREADGAIVGTHLKENGIIEKSVDESRVKELVRAVARLR